MGLFQNLTGWHAIIILAAILLLFGATRLPALARSVGQSMNIFKSELRDATAAPSGSSTVPAGAPVAEPQRTAATAPGAPAPGAPAPGAQASAASVPAASVPAVPVAAHPAVAAAPASSAHTASAAQSVGAERPNAEAPYAAAPAAHDRG